MNGKFASILFIFIATYLSLGLNIPVFRQLLGFVFLTFIPGFVILGVLKWNERSIVDTLLFSVGLSLALLMFIGLLINSLLPLLGISEPLSFPPTVITIASVTIVTFIIGFLRDKPRKIENATDTNSMAELRSSQRIRYVIFGSILFLFPLLSVIGTIYSSTFILTFAILGIASLYAISIFFPKHIPSSLHPLIIYSISISLLLQTVLISQHILGADIFMEFSVFEQTANLGFWHAPGIISSSTGIDLYNSVASVTILPTLYSIFLNLDWELTFKFLYPFIFSLLPLALYRTFASQSKKSIALLAAFFFMSNSISFFGWEQLSVTKQMVAELFLVLAVFSLINKSVNSRDKKIFFMIFGTAVVIAHYSLSFIFLFFVVLVYILSRINREGGMLGLKAEGTLSLRLILFQIAVTFGWYMYVAAPPLDRLTIAFQRMVEGFTANLFQAQARFQPALTALSPTTESSFVGSIHKDIIYVCMFFIVVGLIVLLAKPKEFKFNSEFRFFVVLSGSLLVLCLVVPNLAPTLNFTRFYSITLLFLALLFPLGAMYFLGLLGKFFRSSMQSLKFFHSRDLGLRVVTLLLIAFFLFQIGFVNHITNGPTTNSSIDINRMKTSTDPNTRAKILRLFVAEEDFFSARWLGANIDNKSIVYADFSLYGQILPGYALLGNERIIYLYNTTELQPHSYVYLRSLNVREGMIDTPSDSFNLSDISTLLARSNKIYSNGESEIYFP